MDEWPTPEQEQLIARFAALFAGRTDAYGTERGGCQRLADDGDLAHPGSISSLWRSHLQGFEPIGVYPMVPMLDLPDNQWGCKWGCIDLDVKKEGKRRYDYETPEEALVAAKNLQMALQCLDITGWIERTRSGGYHVWVFASEWVSCADMRRALIVACQAVGVPPTEVNPKNETQPSPDVLGNYVRLPYPGALADDWQPAIDNRVVIYPDGWVSLDHFVTEAERALCPADVLAQAAALWQPPPSRLDRKMELSGEDVELDRALRKKLSGLAATILDHGPLEGGDRSGALFKLANECQRSGLTADEALAVVRNADERWGKYHARPDGEAQLIRTVERAYT